MTIEDFETVDCIQVDVWQSFVFYNFFPFRSEEPNFLFWIDDHFWSLKRHLLTLSSTFSPGFKWPKIYPWHCLRKRFLLMLSHKICPQHRLRAFSKDAIALKSTRSTVYASVFYRLLLFTSQALSEEYLSKRFQEPRLKNRKENNLEVKAHCTVLKRAVYVKNWTFWLFLYISFFCK